LKKRSLIIRISKSEFSLSDWQWEVIYPNCQPTELWIELFGCNHWSAPPCCGFGQDTLLCCKTMMYSEKRVIQEKLTVQLTLNTSWLRQPAFEQPGMGGV